METKYIVEQKAKGTNRWYPVPTVESEDEKTIWQWMDVNQGYFINYDLRVVEITTTRKVLTR